MKPLGRHSLVATSISVELHVVAEEVMLLPAVTD